MENDWTKVLGFPGYRVYQQEIDEEHQQLKLWIRRKRGNRSMTCAGCGRRVHKIHEVCEREIRDLPCFEFQTTVVVELYRVDCPECGVKAEKVPQLPSKSPYSKRFEDAVGQSCESAAARQVARRMGLAQSTVRGIDLRYLERCEASRRKPPLRHMGVDELYRGKKDKFLTVVCHLETAEPLWFGKERKKETLDEYFRTELVRPRRVPPKNQEIMMTVLQTLWLPILLSSVFVFIASSIIHMALPWWHKGDYAKVPEEAKVMETLRPFATPPGDYMVPLCSGSAEMRSPEFAEKLRKGPVMMLTVIPSGPIGVGKSLALWFLYLIVVSFFAGYVARHALPSAVGYDRVFRVVGVTSFLGYAGALWQMSIWYRRSWRTTIIATVDGLIYAGLTAGTFGWLWAR